jgi:hypothetical protein
MGCTITMKISLVIFYLFTLLRCTFRWLGTLVCVVQQHQCDLFDAFNFIIKYGGATGTWMH